MPLVVSSPQAERKMSERNNFKSTAVREMDILLLFFWGGIADLVAVAKNYGAFGVKKGN